MTCRFAGWSLLLLFCLTLADAEDQQRAFRQSCDAVGRVVIPWLKQRGVKQTGNTYRCAKDDNGDCIDLAGRRIRNVEGKRIRRLGRYGVRPAGGQCGTSFPGGIDPNTGLDTNTGSEDCFSSFSVVRLSGTMELRARGSGCIVSLRFAFPDKEGCSCLGFALEHESEVPSNGRLEREYLSALQVLLKEKMTNSQPERAR